MLENFYTLNQIESQGEGKYLCRITLNAAHPIFAGHFPDNPVTPGVCMSLINPNTAAELTLQLELAEHPDTIVVKNTTSFGDTVALKLTNTYKLC